MKKILLLLSLILGFSSSVLNATSVEKDVSKIIEQRQKQASQMQKMVQQKEYDALNRKASPPRRRKAKQNVSADTTRKTDESKKNTSSTAQSKPKTDLLHIVGQGDFAGPLSHSQLAQDGSSGLAYQKPTYPAKQMETQQEVPSTQTRFLKPVEKEYTLSGTTFEVDLQKDTQPTSFQVQTMERIANEVKKENIKFVECPPEDKSCAEYKVDEAGKVIW